MDIQTTEGILDTLRTVALGGMGIGILGLVATIPSGLKEKGNKTVENMGFWVAASGLSSSAVAIVAGVSLNGTAKCDFKSEPQARSTSADLPVQETLSAAVRVDRRHPSIPIYQFGMTRG